MPIIVALIALLGVAAPCAAQPQTPPDQRPPFTLDGVRRAAAAAEKPAEDTAEPEPEDVSRRPKPLTRSAARQQFDIRSWMPTSTVKLPHDDRFVTTSLAPMGSAWHQQFLGMTQAEYGSSPFDMMGNAERVQAVASSMAFGAAIDGLGRLIQYARKSHRQGQVQKVRREIDEETAIVERLYQESQATMKDGSAQPALRKAPR